MIQIDMPMPTNCLDCPACDEYLNCAIPVNGRKWGENDVLEYDQGRPEWCPMKEQEAKSVESIQMDRNDWGADLTGYCPSCKRPLKSRFNNRFCGECGQEVKWE